jgi:hypothetical protein
MFSMQHHIEAKEFKADKFAGFKSGVCQDSCRLGSQTY